MAKKDAKVEVDEEVVIEEPEIEEPEAEEAETEPVQYSHPREEQIRAMAKRRAEEMEVPSSLDDEAEDADEAVEEDEPEEIAAQADDDEPDEPAPKVKAKPSELTDQERELIRREAALAERERMLAQQSQQREPESEPEPERDYMQEMMDANLDGDKEAYAAALEGYNAQRERRLMESWKREQEVHDVSAAFNAEFPEIAGNQRLMGITNRRVQELQSSGMTLAQAALQAGNETMELVSDLRGPESTPSQRASIDDQTDAAANRLERKRQTVVTLPQANARHQKPAPPREPSASDMIAEMRRARGQTV